MLIPHPAQRPALLAKAAYRRLSRLAATLFDDISWRFVGPGRYRQRFEQAIMNMTQGICLYDRHDRLQLVNTQFCRIYNQWNLHLGMRFFDVLANSRAVGNYPGRSTEEVYRARKAFIDKREPGIFLQELGDGRQIAIYHQPLEDGGWVCTYDDITERRRIEAQIKFMAHHDALTKLPNRLLFGERLEHMSTAAEQGRPCALLCLDLDGFKQVNDTLGHVAGDLLLQQVAERLRLNLHAEDIAARLGGDEFAILLSNATAPEALAAAQSVVAALTNVYRLGSHGEASIGASVGIACAPSHATTPDMLLSLADKALYAAKKDGLGAPRLYDATLLNYMADAPKPGRAAGRREDAGANTPRATASLANALSAALYAGGLHLQYQPIFQAATRRPIVYEALVRWTDPVRGAVSPVEFIPVAEETGLIGPLTDWVLREACAEAVGWDESIQIGVNLSPLSFSQPNLVGAIARILAETGLAAKRLVIELTEGVLLENSQSVQETLRALETLGIELWIDDFGTGHANLAYLQQFRCSVIKIDRSFLAEHPNRRALLGGMIALGQACGLRVAVEGVETPEHDELLRDLGCDLLQGFLLGRPVSREHLPGRSPGRLIRTA